MDKPFDLVIRRELVIDGRGGEPFEADVGLAAGKIAAIAPRLGAGVREIEAKGQLVTPGFVDLHTHYDGQVTWDNRLMPSSAHGVTTAIIGNCGVGFAPCRPDEHELLIQLMEGVEDIPNPVLVEGLPWTWESFPDYLDFLSRRQFDIDVGAYMPHAPLRVYVMGQRAIDLESATTSDIHRMAALLCEAVRAGALGFATSRTLLHRSSDGKSIPTLKASEDELGALASVLRDCGSGILQIVSDIGDPGTFFGMLRRLSERSGRPISFSMGTGNAPPFSWPDLLKWVAEANDAGLPMHPQVLPRAVGLLLGHDMTLNPFYMTAGYRALTHLPLAERIVELRRPDVRARILADTSATDAKHALGAMVRGFDTMFLLGDPPNYEQPPEASVAGMAAARGMSPEALAYDLMLQHDGHNMLYLAMANFAGGNLDAAFTMLKHRDVIPGLGDGGAHCGTICDASYSTFMLTHFARDRKQGELMSIPYVVRALSRATAEVIGLFDRGLIAPGYKADINVIDFDHLRLHAPELSYDLPAGGRRLIQRAEGYTAMIVNGVPVYLDGKATDALPGRLVRGGQAAPLAVH
jgi:N-acyl-D-aspartate/D-glutamate deacylase